MLCAIWYYLYNLKKLRNTHGGVLLLVKLQASACDFTKSNTTSWVFFEKCTNGTKSHKGSHMVHMTINLNWYPEKCWKKPTGIRSLLERKRSDFAIVLGFPTRFWECWAQKF